MCLGMFVSFHQRHNPHRKCRELGEKAWRKRESGSNKYTSECVYLWSIQWWAKPGHCHRLVFDGIAPESVYFDAGVRLNHVVVGCWFDLSDLNSHHRRRVGVFARFHYHRHPCCDVGYHHQLSMLEPCLYSSSLHRRRWSHPLVLLHNDD